MSADIHGRDADIGFGGNQNIQDGNDFSDISKVNQTGHLNVKRLSPNARAKDYEYKGDLVRMRYKLKDEYPDTEGKKVDRVAL